MQEGGRRKRALAGKPTTAAAANKDTCPLGSSVGKQDGGGTSWGKERPGAAQEEGLVVGEDLGEFELGGWPPALGEGEVRAGHFPG